MWYNKKRRKEGEKMTLEITTPAVMFPSVSLLLLAYTNRFLALAGIVRSMDHCSGDEYEISQIENLKKRMVYIKRMQYLGVSSLLMCVISMFFIFFNVNILGVGAFVASLLLMIVSLIFSLKEIQISLEALKIHLNRCEYKEL